MFYNGITSFLKKRGNCTRHHTWYWFTAKYYSACFTNHISAFDGGALMIVSVTIFGCTMLFMYVSSTIVHSLPIGKWKDIFLVIDHASIYVFIAGSYTPFVLIQING